MGSAISSNRWNGAAETQVCVSDSILNGASRKTNAYYLKDLKHSRILKSLMNPSKYLQPSDIEPLWESMIHYHSSQDYQMLSEHAASYLAGAMIRQSRIPLLERIAQLKIEVLSTSFVLSSEVDHHYHLMCRRADQLYVEMEENFESIVSDFLQELDEDNDGKVSKKDFFARFPQILARLEPDAIISALSSHF